MCLERRVGCALHVSASGTAWVQTDGSIAVTGDAAVTAELHILVRAWETIGQLALTQFTCSFDQAGPHDEPLRTPHPWALAASTAIRA